MFPSCIFNSGHCVFFFFLVFLFLTSTLVVPLHSEYLCSLFTVVVLLIFKRSIRRRNSRRKRENKSIRPNAIRGYGGFLVLSEDLSLSFRCNLRFPSAPVHCDIFRKTPEVSFEVVRSYCTANVPRMFRKCSAFCT